MLKILEKIVNLHHLELTIPAKHRIWTVQVKLYPMLQTPNNHRTFQCKPKWAICKYRVTKNINRQFKRVKVKSLILMKNNHYLNTNHLKWYYHCIDFQSKWLFFSWVINNRFNFCSSNCRATSWHPVIITIIIKTSFVLNFRDWTLSQLPLEQGSNAL